MDRKSWPIRLMAVMLVAPVSFACSNSDDDADVDIEVESEAPPPAMAPVTVQLQPMGGSMITGEAIATHGAEDVNVRLTLNGLTADTDYEAALKYGMCTDAQAHLDGEDDATTPGTEPAAGGMAEHDPGEEFGDIDLTVTGMTAAGSAEIGNDDLRENEPAYLAITTGGMTDEKTLVACADLSGHGGMNTGTSTMPDATTPAEPAAPAR